MDSEHDDDGVVDDPVKNCETCKFGTNNPSGMVGHEFGCFVPFPTCPYAKRHSYLDVMRDCVKDNRAGWKQREDDE